MTTWSSAHLFCPSLTCPRQRYGAPHDRPQRVPLCRGCPFVFPRLEVQAEENIYCGCLAVGLQILVTMDWAGVEAPPETIDPVSSRVLCFAVSDIQKNRPVLFGCLACVETKNKKAAAFAVRPPFPLFILDCFRHQQDAPLHPQLHKMYLETFQNLVARPQQRTQRET